MNLNPITCPHITVHIFGTPVRGLLDSGASISVISSLDLVKRWNLKVENIKLKIQTANGEKLHCIGVVYIPFTFYDVTKVIPTVVIPDVSKELICGYDFWQAFDIRPTIGNNKDVSCNNPDDNSPSNLVVQMLDIEFLSPFVFTISQDDNAHASVRESTTDESLDIPSLEPPNEEQVTPESVITEHLLSRKDKQKLVKVINTFPKSYDGKIGRTTLLTHKIELLPDAKPRKIPSYKYSPKVEEEVDKEIERLLKMDAIEECNSDFVNPLLPVRKPNGNWRLCLDARRLNQITKRDEYPFPNMVNILERLEKSKYFSIIDLKDAYHQVILEPDCRDYTAFRTRKGLFRYKTMPFGLLNSGATLCRLMNKVLKFDLQPRVFVYLDDIIITSDTLEEHFALLEIVANRLRQANLTISVDKSKFCQKSVRYLGYVLSEYGIATDNAKIAPILGYPAPKTVKEVRRLLGLAGFYQRFIANYSHIVAPISDLLKKGKSKFAWTEQADKALLKLKAALTSPPILANPNFSLPFAIETDSSDLAVGAVLTQIIDGERKCIAYFSKKLSATQRKYSATERECLAMLMAIENFRHFVEATKFTIVTDAMSLTFLRSMSIHSKSPRIARWAMKIQGMDINFEYRKGKDNVSADALSRSICPISNEIADVPYEKLKELIITFPEKYKDYKIVDEKIYKFVTNAAKHDDHTFRWKYMPTSIQKAKIIENVHNRAHLGFEKTLHEVAQKYFWPKMSADVLRYCKACITCKRAKTDNVNANPPCGKPKTSNRPWEMISVDFLGPYTRSRSGNAWVLVITDHFSKFTMVQVMRQAKTSAVITFLENNVFLLFGVPAVLISDNGAQFRSKEFEKFLIKYNVQHWALAAYHPGPNPTERANRVITTAIRASLMDKSQKDWDKGIQHIACAIRNNVHSSTGYSPYFINFGKQMISSGDEYTQLRDTNPNVDHFNPPKLADDIKHLYEAVRINLKRAYDRYSTYYNLRSKRDVQFEEDEVVLKKNFFLSDKSKDFTAKLAPRYSEAVIRKKIGTNCYELKDPKTGKTLGVFHSSKLKKK